MAIVVDTDVVSYFQKRDTRYRLYAPHLLDEEKFISFMTIAELRRWALERNWGEKIHAEFGNYGIIFAETNFAKSGRKSKATLTERVIRLMRLTLGWRQPHCCSTFRSSLTTAGILKTS